MESPFAYTKPEEVEQMAPAPTTEHQDDHHDTHESEVSSGIDQYPIEQKDQLKEGEESQDDHGKGALDVEQELSDKLRVIKHGLTCANLANYINTESSEMSVGEEKALKKATASKSIWRRFFHGFHRRISVILPGFLKKGNKKAMAKARAQLALLEKVAEEEGTTRV